MEQVKTQGDYVSCLSISSLFVAFMASSALGVIKAEKEGYEEERDTNENNYTNVAIII